MVVIQSESDVPRKPVENKRKPQTFSISDEAFDKVGELAGKWGLSKSKFVERAILWYGMAVELDPNKLQEPRVDEK